MKDILFDVLNKIEPYKIIKLNIGNNEIYVCREDSYFPMAIRFLDYESEMEQTNYFYSYNEEHSLEYVKTHKITLDDTDFLIESEILNVEYYDKYFYVALNTVGGISTHYIPYDSVSYISIYDTYAMASGSKLVVNYNKIQYELNKGD